MSPLSVSLPALAAALTLAILDGCGRIDLCRRWVLALALPALPHLPLLLFLLWGWAAPPLSKGLALAALLLLWLYGAVRLSAFPTRARRDGETVRLRVLWDGRFLTMAGIYALLAQIPIWLFYPRLARRFALPWPLVAADIAVSLLLAAALCANGVLRILCTSKWLNLVRRVVVILLLPLPVIGLFAAWYLCRQARFEYDHGCLMEGVRRVRAESDLCATRYPILLLHGVGFRDLRHFCYWGRIPKELTRLGARLYYGNQEAWGTVEQNAADIRRRVLSILAETGSEKVNIIAHSKGGLDARYMISCLGMGAQVASLTTVSTPHRGSQVIDRLVKMPDGLYRALARAVDRVFARLGDTHPDFYTASREFTTAYAAHLAQIAPDCPSVYYQSCASVMKGALSDMVLAFPYCVVKAAEGPNDGLVSVPSAVWGNFLGVFRAAGYRGISHGNVIDLRRDDYRGFDVREEYVKLVARLREMGF